MATMTTATGIAASVITPSHVYHAKANVLTGELKRPIVQRIEPQIPVSLEDRRGGFFNRSVDEVSIEGLISFTKGETRVSGARSLKHEGWVTLATSMIEGFNIFETITSDRVVAQVSTDHPYVVDQTSNDRSYDDGHVPNVTFLGTQFGDLRVSGFPITITQKFDIVGSRPKDGRSYLHDQAFLERIMNQAKDVAKEMDKAQTLPKEMKARYIERRDSLEALARIKDEDRMAVRTPILCSLIETIDVSKVPPALGVQAFGHVLFVPDFGFAELGEIEIGEKIYETGERPCVYFELRGLKMTLGCVGDGTATAATTTANGHHHP